MIAYFERERGSENTLTTTHKFERSYLSGGQFAASKFCHFHFESAHARALAFACLRLCGYVLNTFAITRRHARERGNTQHTPNKNNNPTHKKTQTVNNVAAAAAAARCPVAPLNICVACVAQSQAGCLINHFFRSACLKRQSRTERASLSGRLARGGDAAGILAGGHIVTPSPPPFRR